MLQLYYNHIQKGKYDKIYKKKCSTFVEFKKIKSCRTRKNWKINH